MESAEKTLSEMVSATDFDTTRFFVEEDKSAQRDPEAIVQEMKAKRQEIEDFYTKVRCCFSKVHSFGKQCLHKYLVFLNWQLMSALASLEMFGKEYLVILNGWSCRRCLQNEWPLDTNPLFFNMGHSMTTCTYTILSFFDYLPTTKYVDILTLHLIPCN